MAGGVPCPDAVVRVVAGNDGVVLRRPVGGVADDDAFKDPAKRRNVADGERGAATGVDELARVHAMDVADGERGVAAAVILVVS